MKEITIRMGGWSSDVVKNTSNINPKDKRKGVNVEASVEENKRLW